MKKYPILTVWKLVLSIIQLVFIGMLLFFVFFAYINPNKEAGGIPVTFNNLALIPENQNLLDINSDIAITFKGDPDLAIELIIAETSIRLENGLVHIRNGLLAAFTLLCGLLVFGLEQLKRMINTVKDGHPFIRINVWRIYILATLFFCFPLMAKFGFYLVQKWILKNFEYSGLTVHDQSLNMLPWFIGGVLLLTIGKIMEQGIKIQEEQDLTI